MNLGDDFVSWMLTQGRAQRTAKSYAGAVANKLSTLALNNHIIDAPLLEYAGAKPIELIVHELRELEDFRISDRRGNGMYGAALRQLVRYRAAPEEQSIAKDLEQLRTDPDIEETERASLVNARVGQGRFREDLIRLRSCCAVTRYDFAPILTASHIKPWKASSNKERLDPFNGFLLIPTLDKVFDGGFITFTDEGRVKISKELRAPSDLGIDPTLRAEVLPENREFLAYHREVRFRG